MNTFKIPYSALCITALFYLNAFPAYASNSCDGRIQYEIQQTNNYAGFIIVTNLELSRNEDGKFRQNDGPAEIIARHYKLCRGHVHDAYKKLLVKSPVNPCAQRKPSNESQYYIPSSNRTALTTFINDGDKICEGIWEKYADYY